MNDHHSPPGFERIVALVSVLCSLAQLGDWWVMAGVVVLALAWLAMDRAHSPRPGGDRERRPQ